MYMQQMCHAILTIITKKQSHGYVKICHTLTPGMIDPVSQDRYKIHKTKKLISLHRMQYISYRHKIFTFLCF